MNIEEVLRRCLVAVIQIPVVDGIQIHFHDLPLRVLFCETISKNCFFAFDLQGARLRKEELILHQLLRDGATTFDDSLTLQVGHCGTQRALEIDTIIYPEVMIFGGNRGIDQ